MLIYGAVTHRTRLRTGAVAIGVAIATFAVLFLAFEAWRYSLPHGDHPQNNFSPYLMVRNVLSDGPKAYYTLAIPLAPACFLTFGSRRWTPAAWTAAGVVVLYALVNLLRHKGFTLGSYLAAQGEYRALNPGGPNVIPGGLWTLVILIGVISGAVLAATVVVRWREIDPVLGLFTVITAVATLGERAVGQMIFDRYLIALVPGVLSVVLAGEGLRKPAWRRRSADAIRATFRSKRLTLVAATAVFMTVISAALAANQFAYDSMRWHEAAAFTARGVPATRVDGGFEWLGYYARDGLRTSPGFPNGFVSQESLFYTSPSCIVLTAERDPRPPRATEHWTRIDDFRYHTFLVTGTAHMFAYATHAKGCPRLQPA